MSGLIWPECLSGLGSRLDLTFHEKIIIFFKAHVNVRPVSTCY